MRKRILILIAACLYYSGLIPLARWWSKHTRQQLMILTYHRASSGNLHQHLLYLHRHYRILHIEAALEELYSQRKAGQHSSDPRPPLVLTFDDGYQDNYTHGLPLARELGIPFTIYLVPGYIESGAQFWWEEGKRMVSRAQVREASIEGRTYNLDNPADRTALSHLIDNRARHAQSVAERETFLAVTRETLAVPSSVLEEEKPALPLTWEQVREMEQSGWISFGAHTMHHPILSYVADPDELRYEITECRAILAQQLGYEVRTFAYPIGQMQHLSDEVLQIVQEAGYEWAVSTNYGFSTPNSNRYLLQRVEADIDQHWLVVAAEAAGLWGFISRLRWVPFIRNNFTNSRQGRD